MRHAHPLIVGGGPAGAACAITLARGGQRPIILERSRQVEDALCGGFLSWNTVARLRALGIDTAALGAKPISRVALFAGELRAVSRLPRICHGLSRRTLDDALLRLAQGAGATIERGVHVTAITGQSVQLAGGGDIQGSTVVLATGKHDLRGLTRVQNDPDPTIGLRWRMAAGSRLSALVTDAVELHLFEGGYAGLELQEDGTANLCLAVRRHRLSSAGGDPLALLERLSREAPHLGARLDAAGGVLGKGQAVANIPYGWRAHPSQGAPFRVGDQAAVIPSLAGEGIAIALTSGAAAGQAILTGQAISDYQRQQHRRYRRPVGIAGHLWHHAETPRGSRMLVRAAATLPGASALLAWLSRV